VPTFAAFARLSGQVPVVGIVHGRCFAGNAALLGCSDVIIATRASNIGMGGPAMIEGGGLGVFAPEDIGPSEVQHANGVIDVLVDEAAGRGRRAPLPVLLPGPARGLDRARPARAAPGGARKPPARVRPARPWRAWSTEAAADAAHGFGIGITPRWRASKAAPWACWPTTPAPAAPSTRRRADKAARFMQLCNAHGLPIVSLVDTPGFMVGPEVEKTAQVRHVSRMFVTAAALRVPCFSVVLRKGYGLGAMGMTAGSFHAPLFTVAWPTGEFGGMGLEGYVRRLPQGAGRRARRPRARRPVRQLLARQYAHGEAMNMATTLEIDAVIDPADTRAWLARGRRRAWRRAGGALWMPGSGGAPECCAVGASSWVVARTVRNEPRTVGQPHPIRRDIGENPISIKQFFQYFV
jgi:hypothetical protein